jgi:transposase
MVCDTLGRPLRFILTAGQRHDCLSAKALLEGFDAEAVLADKAYDNNDLRQTIAEMKAAAETPSVSTLSHRATSPSIGLRPGGGSKKCYWFGDRSPLTSAKASMAGMAAMAGRPKPTWPANTGVLAKLPNSWSQMAKSPP